MVEVSAARVHREVFIGYRKSQPQCDRVVGLLDSVYAYLNIALSRSEERSAADVSVLYGSRIDLHEQHHF